MSAKFGRKNFEQNARKATLGYRVLQFFRSFWKLRKTKAPTPETSCTITKHYTTETNGQCEGMNQIISGMLRTLEESQKSHWKNSLNHLVHAYNCTQNSSTGFSPYYLLFGREPCLPIDLVLQTKEPSKKSSSVPTEYAGFYARSILDFHEQISSQERM